MTAMHTMHTMDWEGLRTCILDGRIDYLGRTADVQAAMKEHMEKVKKEYASVRDYILARFFQLPVQEIDVETEQRERGTENSASKQRKKQAILTQVDLEKLAFVLNDFPYNFTPNIKHFVLWSLAPLNDEEISKHLSRFLKADEKYLVFRNPPARQSIKEVFHVHVCVNNM